MVTFKDGTQQMLYIPLNETLGSKKADSRGPSRVDADAWHWVSQTYVAQIEKPMSEIASVEIDPSQRMADVDRKNNRVDFTNDLKPSKFITR
jgi:hypothetical protein